MNPGPNRRKRGRRTPVVLGRPTEVTGDFSLRSEETLISPSVLPGGFSASLLQLASPGAWAAHLVTVRGWQGGGYGDRRRC